MFNLRSLIADHLEGVAVKPTPVVVYVYFDYKEIETQNVVNVAADILKQLISRFPEVPDDLLAEFTDIRSDARHSLNFSKVTDLIDEVVHRLSSIYIIVDAFDECESSRDRRHFLKLIGRLASSGVRLLITARPHVHEMDNSEVLEIRARDGDIKTYVASKLDNMPVVNKELREEIIAKLLLTAQGT